MAENLSGGRFSSPIRHGDTVERAAGPSSRNIHALLRHFVNAGFDQVPEVIGVSDDSEREILRFVEGAAAHYPLTEQHRSDRTLLNVAHTIRAMHDASQGFAPPEPGNWQYHELSAPREIDCVGHHDLAPWNMVFDGSEVAALIDWDFAAPSNRAWDLSYAAHRFVPLSTARHTHAFGWPAEPDRTRRLALFADAYGHGISAAQLLDLALVRLSSIAANIEQQVRRGNPAFAVHAAERHADGYREDAEFIVRERCTLLAG